MTNTNEARHRTGGHEVSDITERLRLHADNKTKAAMQRDGEQAADTIDSLRAQVEALRADAKRYRFIRHPYISRGQHKQIMYAVYELSEHLMDEAIDAARLQEGKG